MQNSAPGEPSGVASMQVPAPFEPHACPWPPHGGGSPADGSGEQNLTPPPRKEVLHISPTPQPMAAAGNVAGRPAAPMEPPPAVAGLLAGRPATPSADPDADAEPVALETARGGRFSQPPHAVTVRSAPHGMKPVLKPPGHTHITNAPGVQAPATLGFTTSR